MIRPESWEADLYRDMPLYIQQWVIDRNQKAAMTDEQLAGAIVDGFTAWHHLGCLGTILPSDVTFVFNQFAVGKLPEAVALAVVDTMETTWVDAWPAKPAGFPAPLFE